MSTFPFEKPPGDAVRQRKYMDGNIDWSGKGPRYPRWEEQKAEKARAQSLFTEDPLSEQDRQKVRDWEARQRRALEMYPTMTETILAKKPPENIQQIMDRAMRYQQQLADQQAAQLAAMQPAAPLPTPQE